MNQIYLNNVASSFPKAPGVVEAVSSALSKPPIDRCMFDIKKMGPLEQCRTLLADMLGARDKDRIILCHDGTSAIHIALRSFPFKPKDRVIITAGEHKSILDPLFYLKKYLHLDITIIPVNSEGRINIAAYEKALNKAPARLVIFNHANGVTGAVNDAALIVSMAQEKGAATIMDAALTAGAYPILVEEINADIVTFTGHKYLMGPVGTGALYIGENLDLTNNTTLPNQKEEFFYQPEPLPVKIETGTPNTAAFEGLATALWWSRRNKNIFNSTQNLLKKLEENLDLISKIRTIKVTGERLPIISLIFRSLLIEEAAYMLQESFGIICGAGIHCTPLIHRHLETAPAGTIRISLSPFNTEEDINKAASAIKQLALF